MKKKESDDPYYPTIKKLAIQQDGHITYDQIMDIIKKGYMRASRIMDQLVEEGRVVQKESDKN